MLPRTLISFQLLPLTPAQEGQNRDPAHAQSAPPSIYPCFGSPLSEIGDVDGDGVPELLVADTGSGNNCVWLVSLKKKKVLYSNPSLPGDSFMTTHICSLGDVDGDGSPDWIIGGTWRLPTPNGAAAGLLPPSSAPTNGALVYSGRDGRVLHRFTDEIRGQCLGRCVAGVGDLDHDGHADILLGADRFRRGDQESAIAYVRSGRDGKVLLAVGENEPLGWSASEVEGVGDVDGDGTPDIGVICGKPSAYGHSLILYSGRTGEVLHRLPDSFPEGIYKLRPCGDLDGDGRADLLVGSVGAVQVLSGNTIASLLRLTSAAMEMGTDKGPGGQFGSAAVFLSDRSALHAAPTIAASDPATDLWGGTVYFCSAIDGKVRVRFRDADANGAHHLGSCVANLGDVNGDGYDDLACGTENWEGNVDGQAFVLDGLRGELLYELRRRGDEIVFFETKNHR